MPHTSKWRRGTKARGGELPNGTAIATFDPVSHRYTNSVDGRSHAAIFLREDPEGLRVLDQWVGRPVKSGSFASHLALTPGLSTMAMRIT